MGTVVKYDEVLRSNLDEYVDGIDLLNLQKLKDGRIETQSCCRSSGREGYCSPEVLIEQRHGKGGVAMRRAVYHPFPDQLRSGRRHRADRLAEYLCDLSRAMRAAIEFGHRSQIMLFGGGQAVEPDSKEARIELRYGFKGSSFHLGGGDR